MEHNYTYELVDGHIIAQAEANALLIDTGAPSSVGHSSPLPFAGRMHEVSPDYMGVNPDSLSRSVGITIDGLVGADIINQYDILIDPSRCQLGLSDEELSMDCDSIPLDAFMGIPIVETVVSGQTTRMFFDTGAKLSYLNPEMSAPFPSAGEERDFYPGVGDFTTHTHSVPIGIGGAEITLRVGTLPEILQATLMMANTGGILGTAILGTHTVVMAPRRRIMFLRKTDN